MAGVMFRGLLQASGGGGGGTPNPPHRYWRVRGARLQGGVGNFSISTLQMRSTSGGADQCSGGTAISDSVFDGTTPASNAFDGNDGTLWSSTTGGSNHWIGYDFGSAVNINEVRIVGRSDYILANGTSLVVESSDDASAWTQEWAHSLMGNWAAGEARVFTRPTFSATSTRWRLLFTGSYLNDFASIAELAVYDTIGGSSNLATALNLAADTTYDGTVPVSNVVDGNTATFWTSGNGVPYPHWITVTLSSAAVVMEWKATARSDGAHQLLPGITILQSSADGVIWTDLRESSYPGVTSGEVQTHQNVSPFEYIEA
jgi:hypothetical protein